MRLKMAVLAGGGVGPEVTQEATNILRAVAEFGGHDFSFAPYLIGGVAITQTGSPLPTATIDGALEADAVLLGAVGDPKFNGLTPDKRPEAGLLQLRQTLAASPTCGHPMRGRRWRRVRHCVLRSPRASTCCLSV